MSRMFHSKYGYDPPEWVQADFQLDKWYKDMKRCAKSMAFLFCPKIGGGRHGPEVYGIQQTKKRPLKNGLSHVIPMK